jgi:hypothetical protein
LRGTNLMRIVSLPRAVLGLLTVQLLAAAWAVAFRLPYEFGGHGASDRILRDLWTRGTALSPPIVFLAVFPAALVLARQPGPRGILGAAAILTLSLVALVAGAKEPAVWEALHGGYPPLARGGILVFTGLSLFAPLVTVIAAVTRLGNRPGSRVLPNARNVD